MVGPEGLEFFLVFNPLDLLKTHLTISILQILAKKMSHFINGKKHRFIIFPRFPILRIYS